MPLKDDLIPLLFHMFIPLFISDSPYITHTFFPTHPTPNIQTVVFFEIWANEVNGPLKEPETSITMTTGDSSITKWKTYAPDIFTAVPAAERNLGMGEHPPSPGDLGITLFWLVYDPQGPCIYKVEAVVLILELALL